MAAKKSIGSEVVDIPVLDQQRGIITIIGKTPLIVNTMSAKAKHTLMLGGRKKTAAERLEIKHNPPEEFLESMNIDPGFHEHSDIKFPVVSFKSAMATAALVTPGMKKTDVQRLIYLPEEFCPIFGAPKLRMDITRQAGMNATPDVRTRAVFLEWATQFEIWWVEPALNRRAVVTLLNNGGVVAGVGDYRQEKGKGAFGTYVCTDEVPAHLLDRDVQRQAVSDAEPANPESAALLDEYVAEVGRRS